MPNATLAMSCEGGHLLTAGSTCEADIGLCVMRQVVIASRSLGETKHLAPIRSVEFCDDVVALGAGVVFQRSTGCHWFGTYLCGAAVAECARRVVPEGVAYSVHTDFGLFVSAVRFEAATPTPDRPIYGIAKRLHSECLHHELASSLLGDELGTTDSFGAIR